MPNWCANNLIASGNKAGLNAFREWLGSDGFKLSKIAPLPSELENTTSPVPESQKDAAKLLTEKYGASNWYDWQVQNWGTKWDVDAEVQDCDDAGINITFDSAWAPPCQAIASLAKLFPSLTFTLTYDEPGMCFAGMLTACGDDVTDNCLDSSHDKEAYREFCIEQFDYDPFEEIE